MNARRRSRRRSGAWGVGIPGVRKRVLQARRRVPSCSPPAGPSVTFERRSLTRIGRKYRVTSKAGHAAPCPAYFKSESVPCLPPRPGLRGRMKVIHEGPGDVKVSVRAVDVRVAVREIGWVGIAKLPRFRGVAPDWVRYAGRARPGQAPGFVGRGDWWRWRALDAGGRGWQGGLWLSWCSGGRAPVR